MLRDFRPEKFVDGFLQWFEDFISSTGAKGTVAGLSGGIDSAVVSVLLSKAIGKKHSSVFIGIQSSKEDKEDARLVAEKFDLNFFEMDLTTVYESFVKVLPEGTSLAYANIKPRLRMTTLYYLANSQNKLVAGTGNKSELMVGYFTKFGDGACDFLPIGSLFKTEVRILARYLGIPEKIINKPPSAGLWKGQTDEEEMGITYEKLDKALYLIEAGRESEINPEDFERVVTMVEKSEHKLKLPVIYEFKI